MAIERRWLSIYEESSHAIDGLKLRLIGDSGLSDIVAVCLMTDWLDRSWN